jgi:hypothetical protein
MAISIATRSAVPQRVDRQAIVDRWGERAVLAMALLCPIAVIPIGDRLGFVDLIFPVLLWLLAFSRRGAKATAAFWVLPIFLAIALLSLVNIDDQRVFLRSGLKWFRLLAMCLPLYVGLRLAVDARLVLRVGKWYGWGGAIAIVIGLVLHMLQIQVNQDQQKLWINGREAALRAGGLVGETTAFGHLTATWAAIMIGLFVYARPSRHWRMIVAIVTTLTLAAVFSSSSRAALLNLIVFGVVLLVFNGLRFRFARNTIAIGLASVMLLVVGVITFLGLKQSGYVRGGKQIEQQLERFSPSAFNDLSSFSSGRLRSWERYSKQLEQFAWIGCGYKTSTMLIPGRFPDNSALSILLETGILGLTAYGTFVLLIMVALRHRSNQEGHRSNQEGHRSNQEGHRSIQKDRFAQAMFAVWCGQVIQGFTSDTYTLWLTMPVLYLFTGLVLHRARSSELNPSSELSEA